MEIIFKDPYSGKNVKAMFQKSKFHYGGGLAIQMYGMEEGEDMFFPWATVTVNLPETATCKENCAFVKTNDCSYITDILEENGLATPTGRMGYSGWCEYPEYDFSVLVGMI